MERIAYKDFMQQFACSSQKKEVKAMALDEVSAAVSDLQLQWRASCDDASARAQSLQSVSGDDASSLRRLNALAQDSLSSLRSLLHQFELLSVQLVRSKSGCCSSFTARQGNCLCCSGLVRSSDVLSYRLRSFSVRPPAQRSFKPLR
jgi:hypothetical protein